MSLDETSIRNKAIQAPPAKKGWHFASDGIHFAQFIEAATIEEAEALYHQNKRLLITAPTNSTNEPQSTPSEEIKEPANG